MYDSAPSCYKRSEWENYCYGCRSSSRALALVPSFDHHREREAMHMARNYAFHGRSEIETIGIESLVDFAGCALNNGNGQQPLTESEKERQNESAQLGKRYAYTVMNMQRDIFCDFHWIGTRNEKETARKHTRNRIAWHIGAKNNTRIFYQKKNQQQNEHLFNYTVSNDEIIEGNWWRRQIKEPLTRNWLKQTMHPPYLFNLNEVKIKTGQYSFDNMLGKAVNFRQNAL